MSIVRNLSRTTLRPDTTSPAAFDAASPRPTSHSSSPSTGNAFMQALAGIGRLGGAVAGTPARRIAELPGPKMSVKNRMTAALSKATHLNGSLLQPIVNISPTRNGRTKINFGDRKFFSGTVSIEVDGQPKRIQVVAERNFRDGNKTMSRQAFYPLDSSLKPDMSTELYKKDNGEWGIADRKDAGNPSNKWLPANAFDRIAKEGFKTGFHRVGDREFCGATPMKTAITPSMPT
jgi:hypothetical protein